MPTGPPGRLGRERVTMGRTKATALTLAGVLLLTVVHAQRFQLAITEEQLQQAVRDAASPAAGWVFGDVMTRRRVRGDYRTADGGYLSDLKTFTTIQQSVRTLSGFTWPRPTCAPSRPSSTRNAASPRCRC